MYTVIARCPNCQTKQKFYITVSNGMFPNSLIECNYCNCIVIAEENIEQVNDKNFEFLLANT